MLLELTHGRGNRVRDVEKLKIDKRFLALTGEPANQVEVVAGHEKFEPKLIKDDGITQFKNQIFRLFDIWNIEGKDQSFLGWDVFLRQHVVLRFKRQTVCFGDTL